MVEADVIGSASAVDEDVERSHGVSGPQRLKNEIERELVRRYVQGIDVLEVGIGTGRIGLALDLSAVRLTGVDASPAMIERCRLEAGAAQATLVTGTLAALPVPAASFDTVIAVDALAAGDEWERDLDRLLAALKPGGRLIFTIRSSDHDRACEAAGRARRTLHVPDALALSAAQVAAFARARGRQIAAFVPYGLVLAGLAPNGWLSEARVDRLVSWIGTDERLYALAAFIERQLVGALTPQVGSRAFVVLEPAADCDAPANVIARFERIESGLHDGTLTAAELFGAAAPELAAQWALHATDERARTFVAALLSSARCPAPPRPLLAELTPPLAACWLRVGRAADRAVAITPIVRAWPDVARDALRYKGVDIAPALAAALAAELNAGTEAAS